MPSRLTLFRKGVEHTPNWLLLAGALAIAFYCVNAVHYGRLPLRIEENEWPPMAKAIYQTGEPVIPAVDTHRVRFNENLTVDQSELIGAWHPPLYLYTLAASMAVLGPDSPHALRAVGAVGLLAAAVLLLLIAREVTPRWRLIGGIAAILLLIHPYAIQGSLFLDIDTSIYAPLILLAIWIAIRCARRSRRLQPLDVLAIGTTLALVTWTKMTTAIVLAGVLAGWWLLSRRPLSRAVLETAAFLLAAAALFFSTYALWCEITGIPFSYTFDVTFAGKSNRFLSDWLLVENAGHWHIRWFGAAFLVLGGVYLVDLVRHLLKERRLRPMDLPYLFTIGALATYVLFSPTDGTYQGKYAFPALGTLILPVVWMLLRKPLKQVQPLLWVLALAIGTVVALLLPDRLLNLSLGGNYGTWSSELVGALIVAAVLLLAWSLSGRRGFAGGVIVVLAALLTVQAVRSYRADYSPMYPIPDTNDFTAAMNDIRQMTGPEDIVVAPKDLAFYVDHRVIEGEDAFARGDGRLAAAIRRYPEISVFARDTFGPPVGPETEAILAKCFPDVRVFGSASVAYRSPGCR
jgi:hypothetical protein